MSTSLAVTSTLCGRDVSGTAGSLPRCHRRTLADVPDGEPVEVLGVCDDAHPEVARRMFDLGFMPGSRAVRLRHAPAGDPIVVRVADYEIALRRSQAACIVVSGAQASPGAVPLGMPGRASGSPAPGRRAGGSCAVCGR